MDFQDMTQVKELAKRIHIQNREKGFWDKPNSVERQCNLIVSEFIEAMEAHRKNRNANINAHQVIRDRENWKHSKLFNRKFEEHIKNTIEDELADAWIRIVDWHYWLLSDEFDKDHKSNHALISNQVYNVFNDSDPLLGANQFTIIPPKIRFPIVHVKINHAWESFDIFLWQCMRLSLIIRSEAMNLSVIRCKIERYCEVNEIDLYKHIDMKLVYNKTRPKMHNKKY